MYKNIQNEKFILWGSRAYEPHSPAAKYIYELNQLDLGKEFYHPEILPGRPGKRKKSVVIVSHTYVDFTDEFVNFHSSYLDWNDIWAR